MKITRSLALLPLALSSTLTLAEPQYESPQVKAFAQKVVGDLKAGTLLEVSAKSLSRDYQSNEVTADKKYKNKFLFVQGTVDSVSKDVFGNVVVSLQAGNAFLSVMGKLSKSVAVISGLEGNGPKVVTMKTYATEDAAGMIRKGSKVHLICVGEGMTVGMPQLKACDTISR